MLQPKGGCGPEPLSPQRRPHCCSLRKLRGSLTASLAGERSARTSLHAIRRDSVPDPHNLLTAPPSLRSPQAELATLVSPRLRQGNRHGLLRCTAPDALTCSPLSPYPVGAQPVALADMATPSPRAATVGALYNIPSTPNVDRPPTVADSHVLHITPQSPPR